MSTPRVRLERVVRCASLLLLLVSPTWARAAAQDGTAGSPSGSGAAPAAIRGTVVDAQGRRMRQVQVRLGGPGVNAATTTDEAGAFEFLQVPTGRYRLRATRSGFVPADHGQTGPFEPQVLLDVSGGGDLEGLKLMLSRGGAITGRVLDELGEPVPDALVNIIRVEHRNGQPQLSYFGNSPSGPPRTNDLGEFRVAGLSPGSYFVASQLEDEFPEAIGTRGRYGYAKTYYPDAAELAKAKPLAVRDGETATISVRLIRARQFRISGDVTDSAHRPVAGALVRLREPGITGSSPRSTVTRADGTFAMSVAALSGSYSLSATTPRVDSTGALVSESVAVSIQLAAEDVEGLRLVTRPGVTVTGSVTIDGIAAPDASRLRVFAFYADPQELNTSVPLGADGRFQLVLKRSPAFFGVERAGRGRLRLERALVGQKDVLDSGLDPDTYDSATPIEIALASRECALSGTVAGRTPEIANTVVVAFAADEKKWAHPLGRYVHVTRSRPDGSFRIDDVVPGEYLVASLRDVEAGQLGDPAFLRLIKGRAARVSAVDGSVVALKDVRITSSPAPRADP